MRPIFVALVFVLMVNGTMADEIDDLATNLPGDWDTGVNVVAPMPKTATVKELLNRFPWGSWAGEVHITTNYTVLKSRQVSISPLTAHARVNDHTAVLLQTSYGKQIVLFSYDDFAKGWSSRTFSYPEAIRGPIRSGDPIANWFDFPARRAGWHLAFVEIFSITNEHRTYKVSDDGDKTIENLRSGAAVVKVIESPGVEMPATLVASFERFYWFHPLKPGDKLLCFFSKENGKWSAEEGFFDPVDYLSIRRYGKLLRASFKTSLADEKIVADKKRLYDEAFRRAQQATTNHIGGR